MKREDFTYKIDSYGYTIKYKGQNIGGAGINGRPQMHWRHKQANLKDNRQYTEIIIRNLLAGHGRPDMVEQIKKINKNT